jgi:hypothetical protein
MKVVYDASDWYSPEYVVRQENTINQLWLKLYAKR